VGLGRIIKILDSFSTAFEVMLFPALRQLSAALGQSPALAGMPAKHTERDVSMPTNKMVCGVPTGAGAHFDRAIALETKNLSRAIPGKVIVNDISVQVFQGEVLAVVGPSGSGKSSFLRLLNRLDEPTGGTVLFGGRDYREIKPRELRRRAGMVMQMPHLFPGTVAGNIAYGPRQRNEALSGAQIDALLDRVGLPGYQDRDVSILSGGEAQRVSLARTLANAPEVLLLDEPTSALDDVAEQGIEDLVLDIIRERRMTCIIITHDKLQAARIAGRTMTLEGGRLRAVGPTEEVLRVH
jgi:putative ABC transport system ATP-binding protein